MGVLRRNLLIASGLALALAIPAGGQMTTGQFAEMSAAQQQQALLAVVDDLADQLRSRASRGGQKPDSVYQIHRQMANALSALFTVDARGDSIALGQRTRSVGYGSFRTQMLRRAAASPDALAFDVAWESLQRVYARYRSHNKGMEGVSAPFGERTDAQQIAWYRLAIGNTVAMAALERRQSATRDVLRESMLDNAAELLGSLLPRQFCRARGSTWEHGENAISVASNGEVVYRVTEVQGRGSSERRSPAVLRWNLNDIARITRAAEGGCTVIRLECRAGAGCVQGTSALSRPGVATIVVPNLVDGAGESAYRALEQYIRSR